jgi:Zn-dependent M32 family carboxypeptidase
VAEPLVELKQHLTEIDDLERALGVLAWDQRTNMPAGGASARSETLATGLDRLQRVRVGGAVSRARVFKECP